MFSKWIMQKQWELQIKYGRKLSLDDFAEMLGCSPSTLSHWMNGRRKPGPEYIKKLEELFGLEVYDALEINRPDPLLRYIENNWQRLQPDQQKAIHEEVEKYLGNLQHEISSTTQ